MEKTSKILVLGSNGMTGSATVRNLKLKGYTNVIGSGSSKTLDLTNQQIVDDYFKQIKPEYIFLCAAKVGGIFDNISFPADFGYINGMLQLNVLNASVKNSVKKLLFLGSNCIYPKNCEQPIKEEYLLTDELEESNHMYALAKIFGLKLCQAYNKQYGTNFISCMPCNLYGPNDNYNLNSCHVFPALIRKIHEAKTNNTAIKLYGDGNAYREFLHVDDMADCCVHIMENTNKFPLYNIGCGKDILIKDLVALMSKIIGFEGKIEWDKSKPNGTYRKLLNISKINELGWNAKISLTDGIQNTYVDFMKNLKNYRN